MSEPPTTDQPLPHHLPGGLMLRRSTPADAEQIAQLNATIFGNQETGEPDAGELAWARDLLTRPHPTFGPTDFTIVEEAATGRIVSMVNLISQRWCYDGVEFGVGRPEMVGTLPDYRGRGLIRAQFGAIHQMSAGRGEVMQAITGIPYFYRQFGYEMALDLEGGREGFGPQVPTLAEGQEEPYRIRPAVEDDLTGIARVYARGARRSLVSCVHDEANWRYILGGRSPGSLQCEAVRVIESPSGTPVGFLTHSRRLWGPGAAATVYELDAGVSYAAVTPTVLRYLWAVGHEYAAAQPGAKCESFRLALGGEHPAYAAADGCLPERHRLYAWYIRVADLPGFLRLIAPVLERRLAESPVAGHTGELRIGFYRSGVRLAFDAGRLAAAEPWQPKPNGWGHAAFPGLTFLQLLLGYRSLDELRHAFADCFAERGSADALLPILFPKRPSTVWPLA